MHLVGHYDYRPVTRNDKKYVVVLNGERVERIRELGETGNPIIWSSDEALTNLAIELIAAAK
jgi:hypothetical protein